MAHHIRERFPDKRNAIDTLRSKDPEFQSMCEDYDACVGALEYWAQSKKPDAEMRVNEYRAIARELENEILGTLITSKSLEAD